MAFLSLLHTFQDITHATSITKFFRFLYTFQDITQAASITKFFRFLYIFQDITQAAGITKFFRFLYTFQDITWTVLHRKTAVCRQYNEIFPISIRCIQCCHTILNTLYHITSTMSMYRQYTFCANSPIFYITKN